jgi:hypothetical protein
MFAKTNSKTGYSSVSVIGNVEEQLSSSSSSSASLSLVSSCDSWSSVAQHSLLTLAIVVGAFQTATVCPGVEVVWGLCGSSVGILLAVTFPSAIYLKVRESVPYSLLFDCLTFFSSAAQAQASCCFCIQ